MRTSTRVVNGRAVIKLHGRLDYSAFRAFRSSCTPPLAASDVAELELNLERVEHLDRCALGMLILLKARADESRKRLILTNCHGPVRQALQRARFDKLLAVA